MSRVKFDNKRSGNLEDIKTRTAFGETEEGKWKMENPKRIISPTGTGLHKTEPKNRPKSCEPFYRENSFGIPKTQKDVKKEKTTKRHFDHRELCNWEEIRCGCVSLPDLESCCSSGCGFCTYDRERRSLQIFSRPCSASRHNPKFRGKGVQVRQRSCSEIDFRKMKRSLRLLGFQLSDLGIYCDETHISPRWKPKQQTPTFRTKVFERNVVPLESLRESIKRAWAHDQFDESHRKLLAQAAYEEWYFRKEKVLWRKREEEKVRSLLLKGKLMEDIRKKKEKSEEEFQKWLQRKKTKSKEKKNFNSQKPNNSFNKLIKTKEEVDKAFLKWKKAKDRELERKKKEKKMEEEKKSASEVQKSEKKATAEKAFLQWKMKLKENEKLEEKKRQRMNEKQERIKKRIKEKKESSISFQAWKAIKEQQIKQEKKQMREAHKIAREQRLAQLEERFYEAEQAFEDWLDKIDSRKQKLLSSLNNHQKTIPWIPA